MTRPHLALSLPELLVAILEHLSADGLMVAALVCKVWSAPAVNIIWRTQTITLSRLLAKLAPINRKDYNLYEITPITQDDWNLFLEQYANRVTKLDLDVVFNTNSLMLISTLLKTFSGLLCSNLTSLTGYGTENYWTLFDLLTLTKLQEVGFMVKLPSFAEDTLWSQLAHRATQIRDIIAPRQLESFDFSIFSQLRSLSTSDYHNLAYCLHLRVLDLRDTRARVTAIQQSSGEAVTFPRLEEFFIFSGNDVADDMTLRSVMPALRVLQYRRITWDRTTYPS
ncbi:hypothetical protein FRB94_010115 [Tulasnella sp. JGI-2019a]|nr:hypothetical protein FRB94_010115 [Tulasnella sp. JGI-2019a]